MQLNSIFRVISDDACPFIFATPAVVPFRPFRHTFPPAQVHQLACVSIFRFATCLQQPVQPPSGRSAGHTPQAPLLLVAPATCAALVRHVCCIVLLLRSHKLPRSLFFSHTQASRAPPGHVSRRRRCWTTPLRYGLVFRHVADADTSTSFVVPLDLVIIFISHCFDPRGVAVPRFVVLSLLLFYVWIAKALAFLFRSRSLCNAHPL